MLICISANPAIDRRLRLENIAVGQVNRALSTRPFPGGKAAHVAMVAQALGSEVMWVGFLGGATGEECESGLSELGIPLTIVRTRTDTRANLELISSNGTVTEILEPGGAVTEDEVERLCNACRDIFAESEAGSQVAISGSLPPGAPVDFYAELIRLAHLYQCRVLLDTSGDAFLHGLSASPDLVKPNREEAAAFSGDPVESAGDATEVARRLFAAGARSVAISLGTDGMLWQPTATSVALLSHLPPVPAWSTVGCGDAALAGFAVAHQRRLSEHEALALAVACGAANCLAEAPGLVDPQEIERISRQVQVQRLQSKCHTG
ncbi:MAG TPA: 1-phosphofructokinase family hexose kinase [Pyrinomonadaceae bacterium]|nr:1-phosphofructokinase family hexose kinase [Pyrinomonadaceae bacterium]